MPSGAERRMTCRQPYRCPFAFSSALLVCFIHLVESEDLVTWHAKLELHGEKMLREIAGSRILTSTSSEPLFALSCEGLMCARIMGIRLPISDQSPISDQTRWRNRR